MTLVSINPRAGAPPVPGGGLDDVVSRLANQIARLGQRLDTVEATSQNIAPASIVGSSQIAGGSITATQITAGTIDAGVINAASVAAAVGTFVSINASQIVAGDIATARLTTNILAAAHASIGTLDAITSNMGSITAGSITGAVVQTSAGVVSRVIMDSAGLRGYASDGTTQTFNLNTGTGVLTATGVLTMSPGSLVPGPALYGATLGGGNLVPNSSFEQGQQPGDATDRRAEGWQLVSGSGAGFGPSTAFTYHGSYSYKIVATGPGAWLGRRDTAADRIPVVPGRPYTFSYWVYNPAGQTGRTTQGVLYWFSNNTTDGTGVPPLISSYFGVNVQGTPALTSQTLAVGDWTRVTLTGVAPSGATHAGFICYFPTSVSGNVFYVDAIQFEQGDAPTAYSPKPDEVLYSSLRSVFIGAGEIKTNNLAAGSVTAAQIAVGGGFADQAVLNGSFESVDGAGRPYGWDRSWEASPETGDPTTTTTTVANDGIRALSLAATVAGSNYSGVVGKCFQVKPGDKYAVRLYVAGAGSAASGLYIRMNERGNKPTTDYVYGANFSDTLSRRSSLTDFIANQPVSPGWTLYEFTYTVPAGVYYVSPALLNWGSGTTVYFDSMDVRRQIGTVFISDGAINASKILANSITADRLNVTQLDAISANLGSIVAGTLTSATIQSAASGARVVLDPAGFRAYDSSSNLVVDLPTSGSTFLFNGFLRSSGIELAGPALSYSPVFGPYSTVTNPTSVTWTKDTVGSGRIVAQLFGRYDSSSGAGQLVAAAGTATGTVTIATETVLTSGGGSSFMRARRTDSAAMYTTFGKSRINFTGSSRATVTITPNLPSGANVSGLVVTATAINTGTLYYNLHIVGYQDNGNGTFTVEATFDAGTSPVSGSYDFAWCCALAL